MENGSVGAFFNKANANVANRRPERNAIAKAQANAFVLPRLLEEAKARGALNETLAGRPNLAAALRNPVYPLIYIVMNGASLLYGSILPTSAIMPILLGWRRNVCVAQSVCGHFMTF
jgi:hypothetical protein